MSAEQVFDIGEQIARARAKGWACPVIFCLPRQSERARAVYEMLEQKPMPAVEDGVDPCAWAPSALADIGPARQALQAHCGPGGAFVGRQLADPHRPADGWLVLLAPDELAYAGFTAGGERTFRGTRRYGEVGRKAQAPGEVLQDEGPAGSGWRLPRGTRSPSTAGAAWTPRWPGRWSRWSAPAS
jgi:hypothetical protein